MRSGRVVVFLLWLSDFMVVLEYLWIQNVQENHKGLLGESGPKRSVVKVQIGVEHFANSTFMERGVLRRLENGIQHPLVLNRWIYVRTICN